MLPGMDGLELVKAIRRLKATPIIYLTTMSGIDDRVRGLEAGGDDYLIKPFAFEELLARIRGDDAASHSGLREIGRPGQSKWIWSSAPFRGTAA